MTGAGLVFAVRVLVSMGVALVLGPLFLVRPHRGEGGLVRFFSALGVGFLFVMLLSFALAEARFLEIAPVAALTGGAIYLTRRRRLARPKPEAEAESQGRRLIDAMDPESSRSLAVILSEAAVGSARRLRSAARHLVDPVNLAGTAILGYVFVRHLTGPLAQVVPGTPYGYVDLVAAKDFMTNAGIYADGVLPEGIHALVALMATSFFTDALNDFRFLGPLVAVLIPLSAAFFAREVGGGKRAVLATLAVVGASLVPGIGTGNWHLTAPLGIKWASVFLLTGAAFAVRAFREGVRRDLWATGFAGAACALIDPRVGVLLLVFALAVAGAGTLVHPRPRRSWEILAILLGAEITGVLPVAFGLATGASLNSFMWGTALPGPQLSGVSARLLGQTGLDVAGGAGILLAVLGFTAVPKGRERGILAGTGVAVAAFSLLTRLHLRVPFDIQDAVLTSGAAGLLFVSAGIGWLFGVVLKEEDHPGRGWVVALGAGALAMTLLPLTPRALERFEPVGSGEAYLKVSESFPAYQWTIVSPTNQFSEVLGHGWHVELWDLLKDDPLRVIMKPRFRLKDDRALPIETPDTFVFVDLRPFGLHRPFRPADFLAPLPPLMGAAVYQGETGAVVEAHALSWVRAYHRSHPTTSGIFFRNADMMVLWIRQTTPSK